MGRRATGFTRRGAATPVSNAPLRNAAAEARRLLVEAAARELGVQPSRLAVSQGVVHVVDQPARALTYAALIGGRKFNAPVEWNKSVGNFMDVKVKAQPKPRLGVE